MEILVVSYYNEAALLFEACGKFVLVHFEDFVRDGLYGETVKLHPYLLAGLFEEMSFHSRTNNSFQISKVQNRLRNVGLDTRGDREDLFERLEESAE